MRIVELDVGKIVEGMPVWQGFQPLDPADPEDKENFDGNPFQPLGFVSLPYQKTDDGNAEGTAFEGSGGVTTAFIGGRDTRCAGMYGNLVGGDASIFAPHPNQSSQLMLKGEKRQAVLLTRDKTDTMWMVTIDGEKEKIQIFAGDGAMLQYEKVSGWRLSDSGGFGFTLNKGIMTFNCSVLNLTSAPKLPVRVGIAAVGGAAVPGVFAMVGRAWAWLELWVATHLPRREYA